MTRNTTTARAIQTALHIGATGLETGEVLDLGYDKRSRCWTAWISNPVDGHNLVAAGMTPALAVANLMEFKQLVSEKVEKSNNQAT